MGLPELEMGTRRDRRRGLPEPAGHLRVGHAQSGYRPIHHGDDGDTADGHDGDQDPGQCRQECTPKSACLIIFVGERAHSFADAKQNRGEKTHEQRQSNQSHRQGYADIGVHDIDDPLDLLGGGRADPGCDDVHIDLSCRGVGGTLLHRGLNQPESLLDIRPLHGLTQAHLSNRLSQSDHRLELSGCRSDSLLGVAHVAHVHVVLHDVTHDIVGDLGLHEATRIRYIGCEEVTRDATRLDEVGLQLLVTAVHDLTEDIVILELGVEGDDVVREPSIVGVTLLVQDQVD